MLWVPKLPGVVLMLRLIFHTSQSLAEPRRAPLRLVRCRSHLWLGLDAGLDRGSATGSISYEHFKQACSISELLEAFATFEDKLRWITETVIEDATLFPLSISANKFCLSNCSSITIVTRPPTSSPSD